MLQIRPWDLSTENTRGPSSSIGIGAPSSRYFRAVASPLSGNFLLILDTRREKKRGCFFGALRYAK